MRSFIIVIALAAFSSTNSDNKTEGTDGGLKRGDNEKFETVSKHLRGFDMAMVETGYRYTELYGQLKTRTGSMPIIS